MSASFLMEDGRKLKRIYSRFKLEVGFLQCFLDERNKIGLTLRCEMCISNAGQKIYQRSWQI